MNKWILLTFLNGIITGFCVYYINDNWHVINTKLSTEKVISLDSLENRIYIQYGGGDAGVEEMLYLTTGIHQDFMGHPTESEVKAYDYLICLSDSQTIVYDIYGKFVTSVPFDSNSLW